MHMKRSVGQLLHQYLPDRTAHWEDGAGIVRLGVSRIGTVWQASRARFVLDEVDRQLSAWRSRGGLVDTRFPPPSETDRFAVGTPDAIAASFFQTAYYCRDCFRFLSRARPTGNSLLCPDCRKPTLRQVSYVYVHGCGEMIPIYEKIPIESPRQPGTIFAAPIRCTQCPDGGVLRMDVRAERLSELTIQCDRCRRDVLPRGGARCPRCLPRLVAAGAGGQIALQTTMRITRHSANNAYYPRTITMLRLDRPQLVHRTGDADWLETFLPPPLRARRAGSALSLIELAEELRRAEVRGDTDARERLLREIAIAASAPTGGASTPSGSPQRAAQDDIVRSVQESLALLSTVRRQRVPLSAQSVGVDGAERARSLEATFARLGLQRVEFVTELPLITATYGYTRRSSDPTYSEGQQATSAFPTTLRPFPVLDDDAARVAGNPLVSGRVPILAREGLHEGLALYLNPELVLSWLDAVGVPTGPGTADERLARLLESLEPVVPDHSTIWDLRIRRAVFGLLHSLSHCAMKALSSAAGLEISSVSEYLFLPLLCTTVYSSTPVDLGSIRRVAQHGLVEFVEGLDEQARRCIYDPHCVQDSGACHGCIQVPEIGCRVFNHGLSRSFLTGGRSPWTGRGEHEHLLGYWEHVARS